MAGHAFVLAAYHEFTDDRNFGAAAGREQCGEVPTLDQKRAPPEAEPRAGLPIVRSPLRERNSPATFSLCAAGISGSDCNKRCDSVPRRRADFALGAAGNTARLVVGWIGWPQDCYRRRRRRVRLAMSHDGSETCCCRRAREPSSAAVGAPLRKCQILPSALLIFFRQGLQRAEHEIVPAAFRRLY